MEALGPGSTVWIVAVVVVVVIIVIIMSVFLERLSIGNMLICAEQVQIQKYKTHEWGWTFKSFTIDTRVLRVNNNNNNGRISRAPFHVKHAQLR